MVSPQESKVNRKQYVIYAVEVTLQVQPGFNTDEEWVRVVAGVPPRWNKTERGTRVLVYNFVKYEEAKRVRDRIAELPIPNMTVTLEPELH